jgi:glycosyltransferase involved in cell wall biosynthesis
MKVLFGVRNDGPDAYYRARAPAAVLRYRGVDVTCRAPVLGVDAEGFDVLVLQRHVIPLAELIMREFQERGKPVVYDVDDWLFGMPPTWPAYERFFNPGQGSATPALEFHERLLMRADVVTCTTDALADRLRAYNERVRVLPNCVLMGDWDTVLPAAHNVDGPVVGWFGSVNHWDNWRSIAGALDQALAGTGAGLAVVGFPEVVHLLPDRLAKKTFVQPGVLFRDFWKIRRLVRAFDVGIAWLDGTPVNRCKSSLKALQYGAAGVPVVASRTVYGSVLDTEGGSFGWIADTPNDFAVLLSAVIRRIQAEPEGPAGMAAAWQQRVWERHSYETQIGRWLDVLEEIGGNHGS